MSRPYDWQDDGRASGPGAHFGTVNVHGNGTQVGSGNVMTNYNAAAPAQAAPAQAAGQAAESPASTLYAYADVIGYSRFNARLQEESQDRLVRILESSLAEAGISSGDITAQDQGDARLLKFPASADVGRILAVMPRHLHGELAARNEFMAPQARLRIRLAYAMGISARGRAGLVGNAPIAVVRLANASLFRQAMAAVTGADSGVIMDDYLYGQYVRQDFRWDSGAGEYLQVHVKEPAKDFAADAWLRVPGCPPQQLAALVR